MQAWKENTQSRDRDLFFDVGKIRSNKTKSINHWYGLTIVEWMELHSKHTSCSFHIATRIRFFEFREWWWCWKFGDIMKWMAKFRIQIHHKTGDIRTCCIWWECCWYNRLMLNNCCLCTVTISHRWMTQWHWRCDIIVVICVGTVVDKRYLLTKGKQISKNQIR